jgi:hypothetical protein
MLRHSLYKKLGKKYQNGAKTNVAAEFKAPAPFGTFTTPNQPEGTISTQDASFAPGVFSNEKADNTFTPFPAPLNIFDVNLQTPQVEQGPLTQSETSERGLTAEPAAETKPKEKESQWQDYATLGLAGVSGGLNFLDTQKRDRELQQSIQQRDSKPLYDYNWMYGRTTSGGTEYQPIIMAQQGANIRKPLNSLDASNVEIEGGEFLILPDGTTEIAKGPSHAKGGIDTILPNGTKVFSNHLRPMDLHKMPAEYKKMLLGGYMQAGGEVNDLGLDYLDDMIGTGNKPKGKDAKKTFAEIAKRYDLAMYQKVLDNPFASAVDKQTASVMLKRNAEILEQLFRDQQMLNGNSSGEPMEGMKNGGINNPGFKSLPGYVQAKIMSNMEDGGQYQISKKDGKYYDPTTKKYYKIPVDTEIKRDNDPNITEGDYVVTADGKIKKFTGRGYEKVTTSKSSQAPDLATGRQELNKWASSSSENQQKVERANAIIQAGINNGTIISDDKGNIDITGDFNIGLEDRMILSEVMNKTGSGFGTDKYKVNRQSATTGYSAPDPKTGKFKGTGSFVAGFTPEMYEQRIAYEKAKADGKSHQEALTLATSTDPKQKAENRKFFMQQIGMDPNKLSEEQLTSNDFYKDKYADVTRGMETAFGQSNYRPALGNDALSGFEHFDAASFQAKNQLGDIDQEDVPEETPTGQNYDLQGQNARGTYKPMPFPLSQAIPAAYGLAQSQETFPYAIPEVEAPYIRPQTLNIQSQLQDADNNAIAAMRYGADPNLAYIAGLDAKQKSFENKQNYDAEGRSRADIYNADAKFKADTVNAGAFNQVYNDLYATAKSNQSEEKVKAVNALATNRAKWAQDENLKQFYFNNFVTNYDFDSNDPNKEMKAKGSQRFNITGVNPTQTTTSSTAGTSTTAPSTAPTTTPAASPAQTNQPQTSMPTSSMMRRSLDPNLPLSMQYGVNNPAIPEVGGTTPKRSLNPNLPLSMQYGPTFNQPTDVNLLTLPQSMGGAGLPPNEFEMGGQLDNYLNPFKKKKGFRKK